MRVYKEFRFIFLVVLIIFGIRSFTYDHYHIPTGSLLPTNAIGDHILVDKMAYGIKYPFSEYINSFYRYVGIEKESNSKYLTKQEMPKRGDIVVFEYPKNRDILYVKRVIALEGDTVEIRGNGVFVNGKVLHKERIKKREDLEDLFSYNKKNTMIIFKEKIKNKDYFVAHNQQVFKKKNLKKITVPKDNVFVLGDNRDHSLDSRYWGFVNKKLIRGKAIKVLFSFEIQYEPLNIIFRPERIFKEL